MSLRVLEVERIRGMEGGAGEVLRLDMMGGGVGGRKFVPRVWGEEGRRRGVYCSDLVCS